MNEHFLRGFSSIAAIAGVTLISSTGLAETRTPYEEHQDPPACDGSQSCIAKFRSVPSGQRLEVESVSCHVVSQPDTTRVLALQLWVVGKYGARKYQLDLVPVYLGNGVGYAQAAASQQTFFIASAGDHIEAFVSAAEATTTAIACGIAGHMVAP